MAIESTCSGCGQKLAVADEYAGRRARCPACGQIYTVPHPEQGTASNLNSDPFADTVAPAPASGSTPNGIPPDPASDSNVAEQPNEFWMKTADGAEYGPVDRVNLDRWFQEGRVGQNYSIRAGAGGGWQSAELFRPGPTNPYSSAGPQAHRPASQAFTSTAPLHQAPPGGYQKADPSGLVLTMGILAWVSLLVCPIIGWIPGIVAWVAGRTGLKDIQAGIADPTNLTLVQVGYYLGMVNVILSILLVIGSGMLLALGIVLG